VAVNEYELAVDLFVVFVVAKLLPVRCKTKFLAQIFFRDSG
jgi:hypothetical protein